MFDRWQREILFRRNSPHLHPFKSCLSFFNYSNLSMEYANVHCVVKICRQLFLARFFEAANHFSPRYAGVMKNVKIYINIYTLVADLEKLQNYLFWRKINNSAHSIHMVCSIDRELLHVNKFVLLLAKLHIWRKKYEATSFHDSPIANVYELVNVNSCPSHINIVHCSHMQYYNTWLATFFRLKRRLAPTLTVWNDDERLWNSMILWWWTIWKLLHARSMWIWAMRYVKAITTVDAFIPEARNTEVLQLNGLRTMSENAEFSLAWGG